MLSYSNCRVERRGKCQHLNTSLLALNILGNLNDFKPLSKSLIQQASDGFNQQELQNVGDALKWEQGQDQ